jgi:hypothetical protein
MNRLELLILIALTLASCSANNSAEKTHADTAKSMTTVQQQRGTTDSLLADTLKVEKWLTNVIESFFKNYSNDKAAYDNFRHALTDDYYNYKQDAINTEYDIGDTITFKKKWQGKYDTRYVGYDGFLISGQDWGTIKVTQCNFLRHIGRDAYVYKVVITDLHFKTKDNRDIKVIVKNGKLLIDDVIEYN